MPKLRKGQEIQGFDHLTESVKRGRRRIKPEFVPELAAWLMVHSQAYDRIAEQLRQERHLMSSDYCSIMRERGKIAQSVLQALMDSLANGFEQCWWNTATDVIAEHLGIIYGEPLPEDIRNVEGIKTQTGAASCPLTSEQDNTPLYPPEPNRISSDT